MTDGSHIRLGTLQNQVKLHIPVLLWMCFSKCIELHRWFNY